MCTDTCPCRDYGSNPSSKELYTGQNIKIMEHNRTFNPNDRTKIFMKFTKDETFSFKNFQECWDHWLKLSRENVNIDMK